MAGLEKMRLYEMFSKPRDPNMAKFGFMYNFNELGTATHESHFAVSQLNADAAPVYRRSAFSSFFSDFYTIVDKRAVVSNRISAFWVYFLEIMSKQNSKTE
jgi:hypothetical protein